MHRGGDVCHCVVDCQARSNAPTGTVDVEGYGFGGCVGFQVQELGDDGGADYIVDGAVEADNAFG